MVILAMFGVALGAWPCLYRSSSIVVVVVYGKSVPLDSIDFALCRVRSGSYVRIRILRTYSDPSSRFGSFCVAICCSASFAAHNNSLVCSYFHFQPCGVF